MCYCDNGYSPISAGAGGGGGGGGGGTITQIQTLSPSILPVFNGTGPVVQLKINEAALASSKLKITVTAGENISALKFCYISSVDGKAYAGSSDVYEKSLVIGMAESAALSGSDVVLTCVGIISDTFGFSTNQLLYLNSTGGISTSVPLSGFRVKIAKALTANDIYIEIQEPITLI